MYGAKIVAILVLQGRAVETGVVIVYLMYEGLEDRMGFEKIQPVFKSAAGHREQVLGLWFACSHARLLLPGPFG